MKCLHSLPVVAPRRRVVLFTLSLLTLGGGTAPAVAEDRAIDGVGNNLSHPEWGSVGAVLRRIGDACYGDGISTPAGADRPSARHISVICGAQADNIMSDRDLSVLHMSWGQFIDHDMSLTPAQAFSGDEYFPIPVPSGDLWFDPAGSGEQVIPLVRSTFDPASGQSRENPREQTNQLTAFLDASMVYGSDAVRAAALRRLDGTGKLRTSAGELLPYNTLGVHMDNPFGVPDEFLFAAGDGRANENCLLTALHTVFVREHNRQCDLIGAAHPEFTGEERYQRARKIVGALVQQITFGEYLPALIGAGSVPSYAGYDDTLNPGIANEFSTVAFRFGHSMVNPVLLRLDDRGAMIPIGHIALQDAFFAPERFVECAPAEWLAGGYLTLAQRVDAHVASDLRNFLFGAPGSGGLDLLALNAQRGRDHGLPAYNELREAAGLPPALSFADVTSEPLMQLRLIEAYGDIELLDAWIGALAEDHVPGAAVGPLLQAILADQFTRLRDGDRFWFENDDAFTAREIAAIRATTLGDVIERNTVARTVPADVFRAPGGRVPALADLELDDDVDLNDLLIVLAGWGPIGQAGQNPRADINGDGVVDFNDLLYLLDHWAARGV